MKRFFRYISVMIVALAAVHSCTDFQEEEMPVSFGVDVDEIDFAIAPSTRSVTVSSGTKWDVSSMPSWVSLGATSRSGRSPYEWIANFSAVENDEYNREGKIMIKAGSDAAEISVTQEGRKGKYIAVESVSLSPTALTLTEGENASLTYSISPANASIKDVSWKSSAPSIATVSSSGRVDAVAEGTAKITVTTNDGNKTATSTVTVKAKVIPVTGVSLDRTSLSLTEGETYSLVATITPSNATNKSVTWSSSNTTVATVSSSGVVTAKTAGSATITVKTADGAKTATCAVTVKAKTVSVTGVSLNKTSLAMTVGDTQTLTATVTPSNATDKSVTWSSSNTSVATVSSSGVVTAKAAGSATITVTTNDGGKKATCSVTVQAQKVSVTGVSLNKTSLSMTVGDTQTLTATVTPSNATDKSVTWSSSNTSVATVSSSGVVTAKAAGSATITVTTNDGGKKATCSVSVSDASSVEPEAVDMGLSVKWASFNLGATKPEEYGDYFAWGETEPYYSSLDPLSWKEGKENGYKYSSYKWSMAGTGYDMTKYSTNEKYGYNGFTDGKTVLDLEDDAAYRALGGKWRMPTHEECIELRNNCTFAWVTVNGVAGAKFTSPTTGNSIFLPAAGTFSGTDMTDLDRGYILSSSLYESISAFCWLLGFKSNEIYGSTGGRNNGHSIRPVCD